MTSACMGNSFDRSLNTDYIVTKAYFTQATDSRLQVGKNLICKSKRTIFKSSVCELYQIGKSRRPWKF